ncbi:MAG TPA: translation initiation factor IF-3 [Candidatus Peribacterales bacterium]|nr:translation initiation factor IF-3 [Candidatus Peribacterales bacterium]
MALRFPHLLPTFRLRYPPKKVEHRFRINEQIRSKEVRLVDGEDQIVVPIEEALRRAQEQELDLIEISPNAVPPVCKILDRGSYLYQLKKKEKRAKAGSKQTEVKMVRFGFRTDQHDLDRLANQARGFLSEKHLVKIGMRLRGRELTNQEYAREKMKKFVEGLADAAEVEQPMRRQGNQYMVIMRAKK